MDRIVAVGFPIRVCLLVGFLSSCGGTAPDSSAPSTPNARSSPESLLEEVKKAVVSKDIEMLVALGHWEGVPDKYPNVIRRHLTELFDYVDPTYSISTMTPQEKADSKIGNRKFTWNIEPYGWIAINSESQTGKQGFKIPIGIEDGKYYLATKLEK